MSSATTNLVPNDSIEVNGPTCFICKGHHSVVVKKKDLYNYKNGKALIQQCFPYLSAEEREIIMSGINGECWKKAFGED